MAGEVCDGFHVHPFHTVKYLDEVVLPNMQRGAEEAGRSLDDVERVSTLFVMTGETDSEVEQAMEPVRQQITFVCLYPLVPPRSRGIGLGVRGRASRSVQARSMGRDGRRRS